jgi:hypothetical protein
MMMSSVGKKHRPLDVEQTQYPFPDLFPWGIYLACHDFRRAYAFAQNLNKRPVGQPSKPS